MRLDAHTPWADIAGRPRNLERAGEPGGLERWLMAGGLTLFAIGLLLPAVDGVPGHVMLRYGVYHYASNALLVAAPLLVRLLRQASPWARGLVQLMMAVSTMWVAFGATMFVAPADLACGYVVWVASHAVMTLYVFVATGDCSLTGTRP